MQTEAEKSRDRRGTLQMSRIKVEILKKSELRRDMFRYIYIELFYNRKRRHSYLGYKSPVDYRMDYEKNKAA